MNNILARRHLLAGALFLAVGASVSLMSTNYSMGSLRNMGPGFLPFWLGLVLAGLGVAAIIQGFLSSPDETRLGIELRQLFFLIGSIVAFGVLIRPLGLFFSVIVLTLISSFALAGFGLRDRVLTAIALAAMAWVIFDYVLGLPLPLWPPFLR